MSAVVFSAVCVVALLGILILLYVPQIRVLLGGAEDKARKQPDLPE